MPIMRMLSGLVLAGSVALAQGSMSLVPKGATGQISGIVRDDQGQLVPSAIVLISRTFPITGVAGPRSFSTSTDAHGFYQVANLPPGSYKICPSAAGMQLLDPCLWSAKHPLWNLQGGQNATIDVTLQTGSYIHVRLDDPSAKIAAAEAVTSNAPAIRLSVTGTHGTPLDLQERIATR